MWRIFERNGDWGWNVGLSKRAGNEMLGYSAGKLGIVYQEIIQDSTIDWKSDANSVLIEKSIVLSEYLDKGTTINSTSYSDLMVN